MKIVDVEQNTPEWFKWRKTGYSASESPAVMAESAYFPRTPYELYLLLTGQKEIYYNNAMRDGHRFESQIVEWASEQLGLKFAPACVEKGEFIASLDGLAIKNGKPYVLEVKTTTLNSKLWNNGQEMYRWQLVHQALVCGVEYINFCVYAKDSDTYKLNKVYITDESKQRLIEAWDKFGESMRNFEPPELVAGKDYVINETDEFDELAQRFRALNESKKEIEQELANCKAQLIKIADGRQMKGCGLNIMEVMKKGTIDYSKVKELDGVDLDQYRKPASSYWVIKCS